MCNSLKPWTFTFLPVRLVFERIKLKKIMIKVKSLNISLFMRVYTCFFLRVKFKKFWSKFIPSANLVVGPSLSLSLSLSRARARARGTWGIIIWTYHIKSKWMNEQNKECSCIQFFFLWKCFSFQRRNPFFYQTTSNGNWFLA